jgi:hypothetical protein
MELKELLMLQTMQGASNGKIDNLYQMFISTSFVIIVQYVDKIYNFFTGYIEKFVNKQIERVEVSLVDGENPYGLLHKHDVYTVQLYYKDPEDGKDFHKNKIYVDALLHYLNKLDNIPETSIKKDDFVPCTLNKDIQISEDFYINIKDIEFYIDVFIFSKTKTVPEILQFLEELVVAYNKDKTNELDKYPQIFTIHNKKSIMSLDPRGDIFSNNSSKREELAREPPKLTFKNTKFNSNKFPHNVAGSQSKLVFDRLKFFHDNKMWYKDKGIPYHLTFMLSGEPGLGKTSSIKAAANYLKRHLFVIKCNQIKTSKQFQDLFTNEEVQLVTDTNTNSKKNVNIPLDNRIYVLEELDILGNILLDRSMVDRGSDDGSVLDDELTLDDFLNVLDGNNEYPGRIVFITSNHVDKFDKALLRGGRIDCFVNFKHPTVSEVVDYIEFFKDCKLTENQKDILKYKDVMISYADVCQRLVSSDNLDEILNAI